jgi:hypothetical protein
MNDDLSIHSLIGCAMLQKQTAVLIGLMAIVLILTGSEVRGTASSTALGVLAPVIIPALFTFYLIIVLAYGRTITEILAAFLISGPRDEGRHMAGLLATIFAWAIVVSMIGLLVRYRTELAQLMANVLQQAGAVFLSTLGVSPHTIQSEAASNASATNMMLFYYTILVFGAIVLVSFSLLIAAVHKAYTDARSIAAGVTQSGPRQEVLEVVQEALTRLEESERYDEVIIKCYKQMCRILSDRGYVIGVAQTAREFAENVSSKLDLGVDSVRGLTFLFEEARYSDHWIGGEKREMALSCLNSLASAFGGVGAKP